MHAGIPPPRADPPRSRHPPGADTPPEQTLPPQWQTPPREADSSIRSTSGRYTSYWNAFLYLFKYGILSKHGGFLCRHMNLAQNSSFLWADIFLVPLLIQIRSDSKIKRPVISLYFLNPKCKHWLCMVHLLRMFEVKSCCKQMLCLQRPNFWDESFSLVVLECRFTVNPRLYCSCSNKPPKFYNCFKYISLHFIHFLLILLAKPSVFDDLFCVI